MSHQNNHSHPVVNSSTKKTLMCVGVLYQNKKFGITLGKCRTLAMNIASFYKKNSRNNLIISSKCAVVNVPFTAHTTNVNKAEQYVLKKYPGFDMYAMVVTCIGVSHAGGGIAHLINFLARDGQHEVGHLLGLEHSGAYVGGKLDQYGDALSVMGKYPSAYLTAPQYYFKKWFPMSEFAEYNGVGTQTFTVKRITAFSAPGLSAVIFKKNGKNSFISFPQGSKYFGSRPYLALHLQLTAGGSQKVASFEKEYYDDRFTGLHITIVSKSGGSITFTVDMNQKSIDYVPEPEEQEDLSVVYPVEDDNSPIVEDSDSEDTEVVEDAEEDVEDPTEDSDEDK